MAITTETFKVNAGWATTDVIIQMEQAMTYLGWQGSEVSGYIVGLGTITGGGDTNASEWYEDVSPKTTSGVGTEATFSLYRDIQGVRWVLVDRPGVGYTSGELVTLSADDIGGFSNGATDLSFKVCVDEIVGNGTTVSMAMTTIVNNGENFYTYGFELYDTDRAGVVGAGISIITVREGDTISVANSYSSAYDPVLTSPHLYINEDTDYPIAGFDPDINPNDGYSQYTFKIGQAGVYFWKSEQSNLGAEQGRVIVLPWSGDPGDRTTVGYGASDVFWDKDLTGTQPWAVQKHQIAQNKLYGHTYRSIRYSGSAGSYRLTTHSGYSHYEGNEYYPTDSNGGTSTYHNHGGTGYRSRIAGAANLDYPGEQIGNNRAALLSHDAGTSTLVYNWLAQIYHGTNFGFDLDLNLFRSAIDPRFVVFSYRNPTISSTHLTSNTFDTFFFHNFDSNIWDYNHVFLAGMTEIIPTTGNTTTPDLRFRTHLTPNYAGSSGGCKRSAEYPWYPHRGYSSNDENYVDTVYDSRSYEQDMNENHARLYYRSEDQPKTFIGGYPHTNDTTATSRVSPEANFNAVIKGIPINVNLIPCPYYIPDDFGLIEFYYNAANANVQQGDTFTISPSEVWTVITASYNQTTVTRGIAFCARTV